MWIVTNQESHGWMFVHFYVSRSDGRENKDFGGSELLNKVSKTNIKDRKMELLRA